MVAAKSWLGEALVIAGLAVGLAAAPVLANDGGNQQADPAAQGLPPLAGQGGTVHPVAPPEQAGNDLARDLPPELVEEIDEEIERFFEEEVDPGLQQTAATIRASTGSNQAGSPGSTPAPIPVPTTDREVTGPSELPEGAAPVARPNQTVPAVHQGAPAPPPASGVPSIQPGELPEGATPPPAGGAPVPPAPAPGAPQPVPAGSSTGPKPGDSLAVPPAATPPGQVPSTDLDEETDDLDEDDALLEAMSDGQTGQIATGPRPTPTPAPALGVVPTSPAGQQQANPGVHQGAPAPSTGQSGSTSQALPDPSTDTGLVQVLGDINAGQTNQATPPTGDAPPSIDEGGPKEDPPSVPNPPGPRPPLPPGPRPPPPGPVPPVPPASTPGGWDLGHPGTTPAPVPGGTPSTPRPTNPSPNPGSVPSLPRPGTPAPVPGGTPSTPRPTNPSPNPGSVPSLPRPGTPAPVPGGTPSTPRPTNPAPNPGSVPSLPRPGTPAPVPGGTPANPGSIPGVPRPGTPAPVPGPGAPVGVVPTGPGAAPPVADRNDFFFAMIFMRLMDVISQAFARMFDRDARAQYDRSMAWADDYGRQHPEAAPYIRDRVNSRFDRSVSGALDGSLPDGSRVVPNPGGGVLIVNRGGTVAINGQGAVTTTTGNPKGPPQPATGTPGSLSQPKVNPRLGPGTPVSRP